MNCTIKLNGIDLDSGAVEVLNGTKADGPKCSHFKSHTKDKSKIIFIKVYSKD